jgi:hypothetical protein
MRLCVLLECARSVLCPELFACVRQVFPCTFLRGIRYIFEYLAHVTVQVVGTVLQYSTVRMAGLKILLKCIYCMCTVLVLVPRGYARKNTVLFENTKILIFFNKQ